MGSSSFSQWPKFSAEEIQAVAEVLGSGRVNYWTGSNGREFEREFAEWCGCKYAVAMTNGTVTLEVALRAFNIGAGDDVVVTSRSFLASATCVVNVGARPIFADVDYNSGNLTADTIEAVVTEKTKAVILVHLGGFPCDMDPIMSMAERLNFLIIEDCAQAHGAQYKGKSVGSFGAVGSWSFCQDKIISTGGEGGMLTCNDKDVWEKIWSYKDHGKSHAKAFEPSKPQNGFRWVHDTFGSNFRMTEMQAVIGRIQLRGLPEWSRSRCDNASKIAGALSFFSGDEGLVRLPKLACSGCSRLSGMITTTKTEIGFEDRSDVFQKQAHPDSAANDCRNCRHAYYRFYAYVRSENLSPEWTRDSIAKAIRDLGVPCYVGSCSEIYLEKCFVDADLGPPTPMPVAKELGETSLAFLVDPTLSQEAIQNTVDAITSVFSKIKSQ